MAIPDTYRPVVDRLVQGTSDHKLTWKEAPLGNDYFVSLGDATVMLSTEGRKENFTSVRFWLSDTDGEYIDGFRLTDRDPDFQAIGDLVRLAHRSARNIDDHLAKILKDLDRKLEAV